MPLESGNGETGERLLLPENASCKLCEFSELVQIIGPDGSIQVGQMQRVCKFNPPVPVMVPIQMGQQQGGGVMPFFPPVADETFCYQFQEREGAEVTPTGLFGSEPANK